MSDLVISVVSGLGKGGAGTKAESVGRGYRGSLGQRQDALKTAMHVPRGLQVRGTAAYEIAGGQRLLGVMSGRGASGGHRIGKHRSITYSASGSKVRGAFFDVEGQPTNISVEVIEGRMGEFSASYEQGVTRAFHHDREKSCPTWRVEIKYSAKHKTGMGRHGVKFVVRYDLVGEKVGAMLPSRAAAAAALASSASLGERLETRLRELMGGNLIGRAEWRELFGEEPEGVPELSEEMVQQLGNGCLFDALRRVKDTHILFCVPVKLRGQTLSIMEWKRVMGNGEHHSVHKEGKMHDQDWYHARRYKFAREGVEKGKWVLMPKEVVPGSTMKTWAEQEALVRDKYGSQGYEVPSAIELVSGILLYYLRTGKRLCGEGYRVGGDSGHDYLPLLRTKSRTSDGSQAYVGCFLAEGLYVANWDDRVQSERVGVGAVVLGY